MKSSFSLFMKSEWGLKLGEKPPSSDTRNTGQYNEMPEEIP
jgi:hypothetical protein